MTAANAIVAETQRVLAGTVVPASAVPQTDLTRAIAGRLANGGASAVGWASDETKKTIARALAEMGQTRTWNLFIDVIAQTGRYTPDATNINQANNSRRRRKALLASHRAWPRSCSYGWNPLLPGEIGCQVDVLGTQLEEVVE